MADSSSMHLQPQNMKNGSRQLQHGLSPTDWLAVSTSGKIATEFWYEVTTIWTRCNTPRRNGYGIHPTWICSYLCIGAKILLKRLQKRNCFAIKYAILWVLNNCQETFIRISLLLANDWINLCFAKESIDLLAKFLVLGLELFYRLLQITRERLLALTAALGMFTVSFSMYSGNGEWGNLWIEMKTRRKKNIPTLLYLLFCKFFWVLNHVRWKFALSTLFGGFLGNHLSACVFSNHCFFQS